MSDISPEHLTKEGAFAAVGAADAMRARIKNEAGAWAVVTALLSCLLGVYMAGPMVGGLLAPVVLVSLLIRMDRLEKEASGHREQIRAAISALCARAFDGATSFGAGRSKGAPVPSRNELQSLLNEASNISDVSNHELSYGDMLHMADVFEGWAMGPNASPEWSAKLLGWADGWRKMAERVGPDWNPTYPEKLSLIGFIAKTLREQS